MGFAWFLLKAGLGTFLFTLILWCVQSQNPRVAGMMLTFPVLNGLGLLAGESQALHQMASAMMPMIAANGLLCAGYILAYRSLPHTFERISLRIATAFLLSACLLVWCLIALFLGSSIQVWLTSSRHTALLALGYVLGTGALTYVWLWCPGSDYTRVRQSLWRVIQTQAARIAVLFILIILIALCAHVGEDTWAGRLSAFPLLPLYTLRVIPSEEPEPYRRVAQLDQLGSTVLIGPLVAMAFVWGFSQYLSTLARLDRDLVYISGGVVGLILGWAVCGIIIWGVARFARIMETWTPSRL